jgi:hypothetical protein
MFNKNTNDAIENLWDAMYLLQESVDELREEIDYLADFLGIND